MYTAGLVWWHSLHYTSNQYLICETTISVVSIIVLYLGLLSGTTTLTVLQYTVEMVVIDDPAWFAAKFCGPFHAGVFLEPVDTGENMTTLVTRFLLDLEDWRAVIESWV